MLSFDKIRKKKLRKFIKILMDLTIELVIPKIKNWKPLKLLIKSHLMQRKYELSAVLIFIKVPFIPLSHLNTTG